MSSISLVTVNGAATRSQTSAFPFGTFYSTANPAFTLTTAGNQYVFGGTGTWTPDSDQSIVAGYSTVSASAGGLTVPYDGLWSANIEARFNNTTNTTGIECWINIVTPQYQVETGHCTIRGHNTVNGHFQRYLKAGSRIVPIWYADYSNAPVSYFTLNFQCQRNQ